MTLHSLIKFFVIFYIANCCKCDDEYHQFKLEDVEVVYFNETYIDADTFDISLNYKSESRKTLNIRIDIIEDLPKDIAIKMKLYARGFGQYNIPTGVAFDVLICNEKLREYFLKNTFDSLNWGTDDCPPPKGKYEVFDIEPGSFGLPIQRALGFRLVIDSEVYASDITIMKVKSFVQLL